MILQQREALNKIKTILDLQNPAITKYTVREEITSALFFFHYSESINCQELRDEAISRINNIILNIPEKNLNGNVSGDLSKIGYLLEDLEENDLLELENREEFSMAFDDYLYDSLTKMLFSRNFSLENGAINIGYYFIKKYKNSVSKESKDFYQNALAQIIIFLERDRIVGLDQNIVINEKIKYFSNLITFLNSLLNLKICTNILKNVLRHNSFLLFDEIKNGQKSYIEATFNLWKSGTILKSDHLVNEAKEIFKKNCFFEPSTNIISSYKNYKIYQLIFDKTNIKDFYYLQNNYKQIYSRNFQLLNLTMNNYNVSLQDLPIIGYTILNWDKKYWDEDQWFLLGI